MKNPITGVGVCLRPEHYANFLNQSKPDVPWLEVLADNHLTCTGIAWDKLRLITNNYPVVLHCVGLGIGNTDPINWDYCQKIKKLSRILNAAWISDHLCWTALNNDHSHGLLPLPYTEETLNHLVLRVNQLQDFFEHPLVFENIATYLKSPQNTFSEADFIRELTSQTHCELLIDINNLFVNAHNHHFCPESFLKNIDKNSVRQYHLAGHQVQEDLLIDTHDTFVSESVWSLYEHALSIIGIKPTCIEWDGNIPNFSSLMSESQKAANYASQRVANTISN